jgi:anaerobic selenocysteine-containing dehydrogenase
MERVTRYRACPLCEAICGLELRFDDGRLAAIRGDAADPFSRGHICPKGNAILDLEADPDRLRRPLRRRGADFEEVSWDEAIGHAGERLASIQREHGADAVGAYLGNPNVHHFGHIAYVPQLLRALRTRNVYSASSVDQWPHQFVCRHLYGHQWLLPIPDVERTAYLLMLGANPVASNGSLMTLPDATRRLKDLVARGRLVVVDPRRTETAEIASEHLFIRPGTDALFLAALLNALRESGPPRLDRYAGRVGGLDEALSALAPHTPERTAERTGVAAADTRRIARELMAAPSAVVYGRIGVSIQPFGTLAQWMIQLLNVYTGNLDAPGGALVNEPAFPIAGPGTSRGQCGRWASRMRGLPEFGGELPVAALAEEIATPGPGQIRALLTAAGNPVLSTPNGRALDTALAGLDFMVSMDLYVNETTRHAHVILPPASMLGQWHYDVFFNAFAVRRVARLSAPVIGQHPDERADWQILDGLGAAWARAAGKPWTAFAEPRTVLAQGLAHGGVVTLEQLDAAPHGLDLGPLRPSLMGRLETESGRIECFPAAITGDLPRLRAWADAAPAPLTLVGRRHVRSNNSWMHNAPRLVKGKPRHHLLMHPDDLAARAIADGARVRVRSASGEIETEVQASDAMMRGVASLPHGFGHAAAPGLSRARAVAGASYNDLSDPAALDAPTGNAALNALPITVEAVVTTMQE